MLAEPSTGELATQRWDAAQSLLVAHSQEFIRAITRENTRLARAGRGPRAGRVRRHAAATGEYQQDENAGRPNHWNAPRSHTRPRHPMTSSLAMVFLSFAQQEVPVSSSKRYTRSPGAGFPK